MSCPCIMSVKNTFLSLETARPVLARSYSELVIRTSSDLEDQVSFIISPASSNASTVPSPKGAKRMRQINQKARKCAKDESEYTTVMIRNIPNKYSPEWLLEEIQVVAECNFLHLPKARKSDANLGYAFVNFVSPAAARIFLEDFEGHQFAKQPNSSKRAIVTFAELQGFTENVEFYSSPKIAAKLDRAPWIRA